jgi:thiamine biosynthesis lipoprotein
MARTLAPEAAARKFGGTSIPFSEECMPPTGRPGPEPSSTATPPGDQGRLDELVELGFVSSHVEPLEVEANWLGDRFALALERPGMGTRIGISVRADGPSRAEDAAHGAFELMDRFTSLLNRYDTSSALSELNDRGALVDAPPALVEVVDRALAAGQLTSGGFDPTVAPLVDLFGGGVPRVPPNDLAAAWAHAPNDRPVALTAPDPADLQAALALVGAERVRRDGSRIAFEREGMKLTLDGVAKGWIVDAMAASVEKAGISDFLIDAGGDIRAAGRPEPERPWTVAVQDPQKQDRWPDVIGLFRGAIATSGSYEFYFDPERTRHHIVAGPRGASPVEASSVTVTAPEAATADALATAVFVLGPTAGLRLIEATDGCECLLIAPDGARHTSTGWSALSLEGR